MQAEAVKQGIIPADHDLARDVWHCTAQMLASDDARTTNEEVFMQHFFALPAYQGREEKVRAFFDYYYEELFPRMRAYTAPIALSREVVAGLSAKGKPLILATNPLFPGKAIRFRVEWAGLDPDKFALMTAYEEMHAAKPKLAYYQEICDRFHLNPQHCVMIGNDAHEDVAPSALGMRTYLIEDHLINKPASLPLQPTWQGSMSDFLANILPTL
jgi:FMN phosphatase YigB (HAD superfamily)